MPEVTSATPRSSIILMPDRNVEASLGLEDDDLTAVTNTWYAPTEATFVKIDRTWENDGAKINGAVRARNHFTTQVAGTLSRTFWLAPEIWQTYLSIFLQEVTSGAASVAASEIQTVTPSAPLTQGTIAFSFRGARTPALAYNASGPTVDAAMEALSTVGTGNVAVTKVGDVYTFTFGGSLGSKSLPLVEIHPSDIDVGVTFTIVATVEGSAANIYEHETVFPSACQLSVLSVPLIELLSCPGLADTRKLYRGCSLTSLGFSIDGQGPIIMSAEWITAGYEDPISVLPFAVPTEPEPVHDLFGNMATVYFGPLGTEEIPQDALRTLEFNMDAGVSRPSVITKKKQATDLQIGEGSPTLEISMTIKGSKADDYYDYFEQSDLMSERFILNIVIDAESDEQSSIAVNCAQCIVSDVAVSGQGNETQLAITIMAEDNATNGGGPATFTTLTPVSAYNVVLP